MNYSFHVNGLERVGHVLCQLYHGGDIQWPLPFQQAPKVTAFHQLHYDIRQLGIEVNF